jgi:hypothetical protein
VTQELLQIWFSVSDKTITKAEDDWLVSFKWQPDIEIQLYNKYVNYLKCSYRENTGKWITV